MCGRKVEDERFRDELCTGTKYGERKVGDELLFRESINSRLTNQILQRNGLGE